MKQLIGYQVDNASGIHWNARPSFEILSLTTAMRDFRCATAELPDQNWQLRCIFEGDIESPTFEKGLKPLDIELNEALEHATHVSLDGGKTSYEILQYEPNTDPSEPIPAFLDGEEVTITLKDINSASKAGLLNITTRHRGESETYITTSPFPRNRNELIDNLNQVWVITADNLGNMTQLRCREALPLIQDYLTINPNMSDAILWDAINDAAHLCQEKSSSSALEENARAKALARCTRHKELPLDDLVNANNTKLPFKDYVDVILSILTATTAELKPERLEPLVTENIPLIDKHHSQRSSPLTCAASLYKIFYK
ncbi:hypothetical protein F7U66_01250 [Vibrio parahaemolyticus]|nr:hypothetical protein [Vibrio parahaemolyticus]